MTLRTIGRRALLAAAASLALASAPATAHRFSIENAPNGFKINWGSLSLSSTAGVGPISCPATLEGEFLTFTNIKLEGRQLGSVLIASTAPASCSGGTMRFVGTLPWPVLYRSFTGTLPNITGIAVTILGLGIEVTSGGLTCTTTTTMESPARGIFNREAGGNVLSFRMDETATIPLEGEFLCAFGGSGRFSGTGTETIQRSSSTHTRISLI